ncbi:hypothetical protein TRFO_16974 [Tritrichomonas foetus]|uniref:DH domain-containing protein n=1 Tax=Tritrichomonas foetus TaxID=1144522 RepID=A0A1J4KPW2_9EUKA|nr:hypothetical protein TRFO_16974 [Tritrichomonas foetus]|eukprot:OHT12936.1 hypothetical protein TRFO_16974 [Tritrichomonas foetus]
MSRFVCLANDSGPNLCVSVDDIINETTASIQKKFRLDASNLWLRTSYFMVCLSPDETPFSACPQLASTHKVGAYDLPDCFLLQSSYINPDTFFLFIDINVLNSDSNSNDSINSNGSDSKKNDNSSKTQFFEKSEDAKKKFTNVYKNVSIPIMCVEINVDDCENTTVNQIISKFLNSSKIDFEISKFYIDGIECTDFESIVECLDFPRLKMDIILNESGYKRIKQRANIVNEIIETENAYLDDLKQIQNYWEPTMKNKKLLLKEEHEFVFKDINSIIKSHNEFYAALKSCNNGYSTLIGSVFLQFIDVLRVSLHYIASFSRIQDIINLKKQTRQFSAALAELQERLDGRDIMSYLITPVQRMPRYMLFMRELCKYTPTNHPDYFRIQYAMEMVEELTKNAESQSERAKQQTLLYQLQEKLKKQNITIVDAYRRIVKSYIIKIEVLKKEQPAILYLCNDLIMIIKEKGKNTSLLYKTKVTTFHYVPILGDFCSLMFLTTSKENGYQQVKLTFTSCDEYNDFMTCLMIQRNDQLKQIGNHRFLIWSLDAVSEMIPSMCKMSSVPGKDLIVFYGGVEGQQRKISSVFRTYDRDLLARSNAFVSKMTTTESGYNGRYGHTMTYLNGSLYLIGGYYIENNTKQFFSEIKKICILNGSWVTCFPRNKVNLVGHTCVVHGANLYIFGGKGENKVLSSSVYEIDTINQKFTEYNVSNLKCEIPPPRCNHSAIVYQNKMYIFGGKGEKSLLNDLWSFEFESQTWTKEKLIFAQKSLNNNSTTKNRNEFLARKKHMAFVFGNEMIIICGKTSNPTAPSFSINLQTLTVNKVIDAGNVPISLRSANGGIFNDSLVIYGGIEDKDPLSNVYTVQISQTWLDDVNKTKKEQQNNYLFSVTDWEMYTETKKNFSALTNRTTFIPKVVVKPRKITFLPTKNSGQNALLYRSSERFANIPLANPAARTQVFGKEKRPMSLSPLTFSQLNDVKVVTIANIKEKPADNESSSIENNNEETNDSNHENNDNVDPLEESPFNSNINENVNNENENHISDKILNQSENRNENGNDFVNETDKKITAVSQEPIKTSDIHVPVQIIVERKKMRQSVPPNMIVQLNDELQNAILIENHVQNNGNIKSNCEKMKNDSDDSSNSSYDNYIIPQRLKTKYPRRMTKIDPRGKNDQKKKSHDLDTDKLILQNLQNHQSHQNQLIEEQQEKEVILPKKLQQMKYAEDHKEEIKPKKKWKPNALKKQLSASPSNLKLTSNIRASAFFKLTRSTASFKNVIMKDNIHTNLSDDTPMVLYESKSSSDNIHPTNEKSLNSNLKQPSTNITANKAHNKKKKWTPVSSKNKKKTSTKNDK